MNEHGPSEQFYGTTKATKAISHYRHAYIHLLSVKTRYLINFSTLPINV